MKSILVMNIGCIECSEDSSVAGFYETIESAEAEHGDRNESRYIQFFDVSAYLDNQETP